MSRKSDIILEKLGIQIEWFRLCTKVDSFGGLFFMDIEGIIDTNIMLSKIIIIVIIIILCETFYTYKKLVNPWFSQK